MPTRTGTARWAAAVVAAAAAVLAAACRSADPAPPDADAGLAAPGWIAYESRLGIRVVSSEGGRPRVLTRHGWRPRWSPDGRRLLFVSDRDVPRSHDCRKPGVKLECPYAVYVVGGDGSGERRLTPLGAFDPAWSPDRRRITFVRSTRAGAGDLYVLGAAGGRPRRVTRHDDWARDPSWSPRGDLIAFGYGGPPWEVDVVSTSGTERRRVGAVDPRGETIGLVTGASVWYDTGPIWSPDGEWLVYTGYPRRGGQGLFVTDARGASQRRVTRGRRAIGRVAWSPDGRRLAFAARTFEDGSFNLGSAIYVVRRDGSGSRRLTTVPSWQCGSPAWSPDGARIAYACDGAIWVMNADGSGKRRLTRSGHRDDPQWRPSVR